MSWTRSDDPVLATLQDLVAIDSVNPALPGGDGSFDTARLQRPKTNTMAEIKGIKAGETFHVEMY